MKEKRTSAAPLVVALFILGLLLVVYIAGFVWLGEYKQTSWALRRGYEHKLVSDLYKPAAWLESKLRGQTIQTWWNEPDPTPPPQ